MSSIPNPSPSVRRIQAQKNTTPLVCLTAYTAPMASLLDTHCDVLLVGDSLGMVVYGFDSTLPVTLDMMIAHGAAVVRGARQAVVVVDMPFGSYQASPAQAFENAARVLKETGAHAVKLEGGSEMAETIAFLTARGVPVMAHIGLMPQHVHSMGGFKTQGRTEDQARYVRASAQAITQAGAFCVVIEGVVETLAREITQSIAIPTIGIGASAACDGQVLVIDDVLGLSPTAPKFVRRYGDLTTQITQAVNQFAADVHARKFPSDAETYGK